MTSYLDSSVLISIAFQEPGHLTRIESFGSLISSRILMAECLRTLLRLQHAQYISEDEFVQKSEFFQKAFRSITLIDVSKSILDRSMQSFGIHVKTLDAIHLSSALLWRESKKEEVSFLTHDDKQSKAARVLGFQVLT